MYSFTLDMLHSFHRFTAIGVQQHIVLADALGIIYLWGVRPTHSSDCSLCGTVSQVDGAVRRRLLAHT